MTNKIPQKFTTRIVELINLDMKEYIKTSFNSVSATVRSWINKKGKHWKPQV